MKSDHQCDDDVLEDIGAASVLTQTIGNSKREVNMEPREWA